MTDDCIQLITHQGKQILTVDLSNCSAPRVEKILREAPEVVATYPLEATITRFSLGILRFDRNLLQSGSGTRHERSRRLRFLGTMPWCSPGYQ